MSTLRSDQSGNNPQSTAINLADSSEHVLNITAMTRVVLLMRVHPAMQLDLSHPSLCELREGLVKGSCGGSLSQLPEQHGGIG